MNSKNKSKLVNSPNFIGIGAIKCGTTWLHACLKEHPDIFSPKTKEIEFFNKRYALGTNWYLDQFANAKNKISGEFTPAYLHDPICVDRIYALNPEVRIIVCLRNPLDRCFSHFMMKNRESRKTINKKLKQFDTEIRSEKNDYLLHGRYAEQLQSYIDRFGRDRVHIVLFDEIIKNPLTVLKNIFLFLGVEENFIPNSINLKINPASAYRNTLLFSYLRKLVQFIERNISPRLILKMKTNGFRDKIINWWRIEKQNKNMLEETKIYLKDYYAKPNQELEKLIDMDLSIWS
ncbi:MAG: sulfotransferase [Pseudomonadota bacterium]|nr:sulfotransferase [Pseudomonadota bacterium]